MKLTYTKSQYDVPVGKYTARFTGVTLKDPSGKLDEKGKPMPPGMTWDFVIVGGEHDGKQVDRLTGRIPTPKASCGKMLAAISDEVLKDGAEVDLGQFVGKLYRITVEESNGDRTRLSDSPAPVRIYDERPMAPAAPGAGKTPPKPPAGKPKAKPASESKWMLHDPAAGEYVAKTGAEVEKFLDENKFEASAVFVYPDDGTDPDPKTADAFGFNGHVPF